MVSVRFCIAALQLKNIPTPVEALAIDEFTISHGAVLITPLYLPVVHLGEGRAGTVWEFPILKV
jgi:hypothetical protein